MDYFVSADIMEHPHRTRMHVADEPYTEQVVLTEGQGIWYFKPESPEGSTLNFLIITRVNNVSLLRSYQLCM